MPGIVPTVMCCMRLDILWKKGEEKAGWVESNPIENVWGSLKQYLHFILLSSLGALKNRKEEFRSFGKP